MRVARMAAATMVACAWGSACAADGFYFGASAGQATYDFEPLRLPMLVGTPGLPVPDFSFNPPAAGWGPLPPSFSGGVVFATPVEMFWGPGPDDEATTWNALVGYRFSPYLAIELAYHDFGTLREYRPSITIGQITTVEVRSKMESTGVALSLLGQLPITDQWSVYLRAGGLMADQEVTRRFPGSTFNESYDSEVFLYGIGTQLDIGSRWTARLDFQSYDDVGKGNGLGQADVESLTLSVLFRL